MMTKISWWRTKFGKEEIDLISSSIMNEHISQGDITEQFEREIADTLGIPYVVATTSGSMAILMALMAAGVGPGDEVIVPNRTWIATAHAPLLLGAKVVLVDVEPGRPIIDTGQIEKKITKKTKAIIPVHLDGRSANMREINRIAASYKLKVIEDTAQAFCSRNADGFLGCQSFIGCFSLSVAKLISTGQGGFLATKDEKIYRKLKLLRTHGVNDLINVSYTQPGFNFRFTDIQASIGIAQLHKISDRIAKIKAIYDKYNSSLGDLDFLKIIPVDVKKGEIPIYIEVLCRDREKVTKFLIDHDIHARPFYPNLNCAAYFASKDKFPCSDIFDAQGLFLPSGPMQPMENIEHVIKILHSYGGK